MCSGAPLIDNPAPQSHSVPTSELCSSQKILYSIQSLDFGFCLMNVTLFSGTEEFTAQTDVYSLDNKQGSIELDCPSVMANLLWHSSGS
jgi:hypothetical protein